MKKAIITLFLFSTILLNAGYAPRGINEYFSDGKVYYRAITDKQEEKGFLSSKMSNSRSVNIQVFDLDSKASSKLFKNDLGKNKSISSLIFERPVSTSNSYRSTSGYFQNSKIHSKIKNRIIVIVYDSEKKTDTLWSSDKLGNELKEITVIKESEDWHIDSTNQLIRVFSKKPNSFEMRTYPW